MLLNNRKNGLSLIPADALFLCMCKTAYSLADHAEKKTVATLLATMLFTLLHFICKGIPIYIILIHQGVEIELTKRFYTRRPSLGHFLQNIEGF